jgi:hypothetical protein
MKNNFIVSSDEKKMILEMHNSKNPKSILNEQNQGEVKSIIYASTSPESIPNQQLMDRGLSIPEEMKTQYPNIENVVFRSTVSSIISTDNLSTFKPVRITKTPMDVLMVGKQGGEYQQGGVTPEGGISFFSNSSDSIDASHNGLLVLLRAIDKYKESGNPQDIKFIVKMGQQTRYSAFMNLKNINLLNISPSIKGSFENMVISSIIPDGKFSSENYKVLFDKKTKEQRIKILTEKFSSGISPYLKKIFPFVNTTGPKVDFSGWVNNFYGKDFKDPGLVSTFNQIFKTSIDHFNDSIKNEMYLPWFKNTGIAIPEINSIIEYNSKLVPANPSALSSAIMLSPSAAGKTSKPAPSGASSSTSYGMGQSTNKN